MTTLREAAQAALEREAGPEQVHAEMKALAMLRTALAEHVPETNFGNIGPVAWMGDGTFISDAVKRTALPTFAARYPTPLYTHPQPEPVTEPVAWYVERIAPGKRDHGRRLGPWFSREAAEEWVDDVHVLRTLYAATPREPVRLTRVAIDDIAAQCDAHQLGHRAAGEFCAAFARAIEAAVLAANRRT